MKHFFASVSTKIKGALLLESLMALFIGCILICTSSMMFRQFSQLKINSHTDIAYCIYSMTQEINTSNDVEVFDHSIILHQNEKTFEFSLHNHSLVKRPGYNIFLHQVDDLYFTHDDRYVYMTIQRGEQLETFTIGIYKRPEKRLCQPSDDDSISDINSSDCIDHDVIE